MVNEEPLVETALLVWANDMAGALKVNARLMVPVNPATAALTCSGPPLDMSFRHDNEVNESQEVVTQTVNPIVTVAV